MSKRRTQNSDENYYDDVTDNPIGLTSAFEVIRDPQSVEYDVGDEAIGLTEAFAVVGEREPLAWDEGGKWRDFDWNADWEGPDSESVESPAAEDVADESADTGKIAPVVADAGGVEEGGSDSMQSETEVAGEVAETAEQDEATHVPAPGATGEFEISQSAPFHEQARDFDVQKDLAHASAAQASGRFGRRGKHSAGSVEASERLQRSHRTRRFLRFIVFLLIVALCVLGFFIFRTVTAGQQEAAHQVQERIESPKENETELTGDDTVETAAQLADVPNLTKLLGMKSGKAVKTLKRGAFVSNNQKVKEKGSVIKTNLTVALADEPADSKTGTPSVYLGLDKGGRIVQAGYSASASALGFGSLSFADAVNGEHVIEQTLRKVGIEVEDGVAVLPKNSAKYVTYASDGKTVSKERCSFEGDVDVDGIPCTWSAVLSYDYTTQIITGNLSDTVRVIYVYVTQK